MEYKKGLPVVGMIVFTVLISSMVHRKTKPEETIKRERRENRLKYTERLLENWGLCHDMHIFLPIRVEAAKRANEIKTKLKEGSKVALLKRHGADETWLVGAMLGLLVVSVMISLADVLKEKRESPDSDPNERCSLAEFANMKRPRKDSSDRSRICIHRESVVGIETPETPPAQSIPRPPFKLLGARPVPLLRRSSFPAVSLLEYSCDPQKRRLSVDSEDDSSPDASRRRIRIIRRH